MWNNFQGGGPTTPQQQSAVVQQQQGVGAPQQQQLQAMEQPQQPQQGKHFNGTISTCIFDYTITIVNSLTLHTNSMVILYWNTGFERGI